MEFGEILDAVIENPLVRPLLNWGEKKKAFFVQQGVKSALLFDENGRLETTAVLEAQSVDVTVGDVDLSGDSILALQAVKSNTSQVVAVDSTTTVGTDYLQYSDGTIRKWTSNVRYKANVGTLWANRTTATYTAETV